jgi:hypothetical protein
VERSAASNTLTALGGGFGQAIARGEDRTNHRHAPGATPANAGSHFRRLPIHPLIFSPSPLRHFIEQGLIPAPTFLRCAGRAAGGTDADKLAR